MLNHLTKHCLKYVSPIYETVVKSSSYYSHKATEKYFPVVLFTMLSRTGPPAEQAFFFVCVFQASGLASCLAPLAFKSAKKKKKIK